MVMDGCHPEDSAPLSKTEARINEANPLDDYGQGFHDKDPTYDNQEKFGLE